MIDWKFEGLMIDEVKFVIEYLESIDEFDEYIMNEVKLNFKEFELNLLFGYEGLEFIEVKRKGE